MFLAIVLSAIVVGVVQVEAGCNCKNPRNYLILLDDSIPMQHIWSITKFVAKAAKHFKSISDKNSVAVATFSGPKFTFAESKHRFGNAFEQAILDLDLYTSSEATIKKATETAIKMLADSGESKPVMVIFVVGSKGKTDAEDTSNEEEAKKIFAGKPLVGGFAIGIGKNIHGETLKALAGAAGANSTQRVWRTEEFLNLDLRDMELSLKICGL